MIQNNAYQNLFLKGIDISLGGTIPGLKEKIKNILSNKVVIFSGVKVGDDEKLPQIAEIKKYITYTEEPEDWDEEEQGEFISEEVYNLEVKNLYGYDLKIVDDEITSTETEMATKAYVDNQSLLENIKDEDGHNRFLIIPFTPTVSTGFIYTYSKMVLNGYSLRIVIAGNIVEDTESKNVLTTITIPEWIHNKIYPTRSDGAIIGTQCEIIAPIGATNSVESSLFKFTANRLNLYISNVATERLKYFRAEYNLTIE